MKEIAVITANFGGFDTKKEIPKQTVEYDRFYYTEETFPFPMPCLNNRLRGKYVKTQTHRIQELRPYRYHVWLDASIQVKSENFIESLIPYGADDMVMYRHPDRNCIYNETAFIMNEIIRGNQYLINRYAEQPLAKEAEYYRSKGYPANIGLFACGIWGRRTDMLINMRFDNWWNSILMWSNFDQVSFMYNVVWGGIKVKELQEKTFVNNSNFELVPHLE